jgi:hypothetical protein
MVLGTRAGDEKVLSVRANDPNELGLNNDGRTEGIQSV